MGYSTIRWDNRRVRGFSFGLASALILLLIGLFFGFEESHSAMLLSNFETAAPGFVFLCSMSFDYFTLLHLRSFLFLLETGSCGSDVPFDLLRLFPFGVSYPKLSLHCRRRFVVQQHRLINRISVLKLIHGKWGGVP